MSERCLTGEDYSDSAVLTKLILDNWNIFKPVFINERRTRVAFEALNVYRRRVAHVRPLLSFERDLLSGISGQIRNQVAIAQQKREGAEPVFYAQIETAVDSLGRDGYRPDSIGYYRSIPLGVVRADESLSFHLTATDPRDRELQWAIATELSLFMPPTLAVYSEQGVTGRSVSFDWTPKVENFAPIVHVWVSVRNASPYNKITTADDWRVFVYRFEPPY